MNVFMASHALCKDLFSDIFFTIIDSEIVDCEKESGIDKDLCFKVLKSEKIVLLKNDKITKASEHMDCRYKVSFASEDK